MREVKNNTDETIELFLKSRYGACIARYELEPHKSARLPLFSKTQKLIDSHKEELFIYEGEGALDLTQCYKKYDFRDLRVCEIDHYLMKKCFIKGTRYKQKQKIKDFCALLFTNFERDYIIPPLYEKLQEELLFGKDE